MRELIPCEQRNVYGAGASDLILSTLKDTAYGALVGGGAGLVLGGGASLVGYVTHKAGSDATSMTLVLVGVLLPIMFTAYGTILGGAAGLASGVYSAYNSYTHSHVE